MYSYKVAQANFIENTSKTNEDHIVTACLDYLTVNNTSNDDVITIHNTIGQYVTMFDVDDTQVLYATNCYMEPVAKV